MAVIGVVVREDDVGDLLRSQAVLAQGPDQERLVRHHSGIDHDRCVAVHHQADRGGHAVVADVAGVQDVELGRHARSLNLTDG